MFQPGMLAVSVETAGLRHLRRRLLGRARHAGADGRRRRPRHLLVEYPPKVAVSLRVNNLKGVSSRLLRQQRPDIRTRYWKGMLWSPSYFASSCGGAPISIVRQYIQQQKTPNDIHDCLAVGAILPALKDGACRGSWSEPHWQWS